MSKRKTTKQHVLGQYMTTEEVARDMCQYFKTDRSSWVVFDPACGDGVLLEAAANELAVSGVPVDQIQLIGFDVDQDMINKAAARLQACQAGELRHVVLKTRDTIRTLTEPLFNEGERELLKDVNILIGNPPYGKGMEVRFFEVCDSYFKHKAELVFLLPMSFVDAIHDVKYTMLKGRPLGVTTGHVIVHHRCGDHYSRKAQKESLDQVQGFQVLTGVKLYAVGDGNPPQSQEVVRSKPYSSDHFSPEWLPCLRTGDIHKFSYKKGRLWVNYGAHLAHPKDIGRFSGPRLFLRRVPIWACKSLGATLINETALCAGDVLVVKHVDNDEVLLKGLCVFLNSSAAADYIVARRPSVGHRDSFPKISAKDVVRLLREMLPAPTLLRNMARDYPEQQ